MVYYKSRAFYAHLRAHDVFNPFGEFGDTSIDSRQSGPSTTNSGRYNANNQPAVVGDHWSTRVSLCIKTNTSPTITHETAANKKNHISIELNVATTSHTQHASMPPLARPAHICVDWIFCAFLCKLNDDWQSSLFHTSTSAF